MSTENQLSKELKSFQDVWQGGYYEGNPLDSLGPSSFGEFGYISTLYAVYVYCIRPYVTSSTAVLEIGPGRGAWTKTMLHAREIWCLDAKSREDNEIDFYLGCPKNLNYFQVKDFACCELPDDKFDYFFSFGALCHVSWTGIEQYIHNLYPKLRHGAHGFIMVADYDKANQLMIDPWRYNVIDRVHSAKRMWLLRALDHFIGKSVGKRSLFLDSLAENYKNRLARFLGIRLLGKTKVRFKDKQEDDVPRPGRWYHAGIERTVALLERVGFEVIERDVDLVPRDPVIHFRKV